MKKYTFSGNLIKINDEEILIQDVEAEEPINIMDWILEEAEDDVDYDTVDDRVIIRITNLNDAFKFKIAFGDAIQRIDG